MVTADDPGPTTPTMLLGFLPGDPRWQPPSPPLLLLDGSDSASRMNSADDGVTRDRMQLLSL